MNALLEVMANLFSDSEFVTVTIIIAALIVAGIAFRLAYVKPMSPRRSTKAKDDEVRNMIVQMGIENRKRSAELTTKLQLQHEMNKWEL